MIRILLKLSVVGITCFILPRSKTIFLLRFLVVPFRSVAGLIFCPIGRIPVVAVSIPIGGHGKMRSEGLRGGSRKPLLEIALALLGGSSPTAILSIGVLGFSPVTVSSTTVGVGFIWPVGRS